MISLDNVTVRFSGEEIFAGVSLMIREKDRVGLAGRNGAGKTTLLRLLNGELQADEGGLHMPRDLTIGYLPQHLEIRDQRTVYEEVALAFEEIQTLREKVHALSEQLTEVTDYESEYYQNLVSRLDHLTERLNMLDDGTMEQKIEQTLMGLGFLRSDFNRPTSEFSGGWRMRIELARILLKQPGLLLLDEPINHLDIKSIKWFEDFLKVYGGTAILIAHDRDFLDNVTNRTVELSMGRAFDYDLPYTQYRKKRREQIELQRAARKNQDKKIEQEQRFIDRFRYKASKASQVQSRIKQLEKIERIQIEEEDHTELSIKFPPAIRSGKVVVEMEGIYKSYGNLNVLDDVDLTIERGEKVAFVGKNGEGKSTLIKVITGEVDYSGKRKIGHNVKIGYFAQDQAQKLHPDKTVFQTIDEVAEGEVRKQVRDILGSFLFTGEDIDKKVSVLSGGEKNRLALAKLLLEPYSFLILDEPTNHLDIRSKELLKKALNQYEGTVIVVSHDRNFLDGLTEKIYEFKNRNVKEHTGSIYELLNKQDFEEMQVSLRRDKPKQVQKTNDKSENKKKYEERKALDRDIRKAGNRVSKVEREITSLEDRMEEMKKQLAGDAEKQPGDDLFQEYNEAEQMLSEKLDEWETLNEKLEQLKQKRENLL